jgi:4-hydroxy-tetrahydrodipicolinate synthase
MFTGRHVCKLAGYAPALPTPFEDDEAIDAAAFEHFCELQISNGATALVVGGTTGEAPNLTREEHCRLLHIATGVSRGRVPIIAGAGSNATQHAIELTKDAEVSGADAILSIVPYYNRPTQSGLYAHFSQIAASTGLPIILYDVPTRTACSLADETVARLAELPQIAGLKDATGDPSRIARLRMLIGTGFRLFSGDDATALTFIAQGGDGCISVTANVAPGFCRDMFLTLRQGQITRAQRLSYPIAQLTAALFRETNPAPVKFALSLFGLMAPRVRLPLVEIAEKTKIELAGIVARLCNDWSASMIGRIGKPLGAWRRAS